MMRFLSRLAIVLLSARSFVFSAAEECIRPPACTEPLGTCLTSRDVVSPRPECPEHFPKFTYDVRNYDPFKLYDEFCASNVYRLPTTGALVTLPRIPNEVLSKVYNDYDDNLAIDYPDHPRFVGQGDFVREAMKGKKGPFTIAEMGCNRGWLLFNVRHLAGKGGKLICFDPDPDGQPWRETNFDQAQKDVPGLMYEHKVSLLNAELLAPESVDVFLSSHAVEHGPDVCEFVDALNRIVKPGGTVFTEFPDDAKDFVNYTMFGNKFHLGSFNEHTFDAVMKRNGFKQVLAKRRTFKDLEDGFKAHYHYPWRAEIRMAHVKMSKKEREESESFRPFSTRTFPV